MSFTMLGVVAKGGDQKHIDPIQSFSRFPKFTNIEHISMFSHLESFKVQGIPAKKVVKRNLTPHLLH